MCRRAIERTVPVREELAVWPPVFLRTHHRRILHEAESKGRKIRRPGRRLGIAERRGPHPDSGGGRCSRQRDTASAKQARRLHVRELLLGQAGKTASVRVL